MKMRISLSSFAILTLMSVCQGFSFNRSDPIVNSNNSAGSDSDVLLTTKEIEFQNLKILPSLIEEFIIPIDDDDSVKIINADVPTNIILLFIQESGLDGDAIWKDLRRSTNFPIRGLLQSCQNERNFAKFPLEESMNYGESQCDCDSFLRTNAENLLDWAHRAKIASANSETRIKLRNILEKYGIVSSPIFNYTLPSSLAIDAPTLHTELFGERTKLESDWNLVDLNNGKFFPFLDIANLRDGDELSDFFQQFSIIRIAFFQKWLDSLYNNSRNSEPFEANLLELIKDTIKRSNSLSNDKGFILIAFSPGNELSPAIDFLKETISGRDTLLLVSGTCSQDKKGVPFFAHGPGSKYFYEANSVWDLPILVKRAASSCEGLWCKIESFKTKWDLKRKLVKRTAKSERPATIVENPVGMNNMILNITTTTADTIVQMSTNNSTVNNDTIINKTTSKVPVDLSQDLPLVENSMERKNTIVDLIDNTTAGGIIKTPIDNSTVNNASIINMPNTEVPVVPLNELNLKNSTPDNQLKDTNNSFADSTTNTNLDKTENASVKELKNSSPDNKLKDTKASVIDTNVTDSTISITFSSTENTSVKEKKSTTEKTIDQGIENVRFEMDTNHVHLKEEKSENIKNTKNEVMEEDSVHSEASAFSKETTSAVISVATSFAAMLLFHF